jgi:plastocyanin
VRWKLLVYAMAGVLVACSTSSNTPKSGETVVLGGQRVLNRGTIDVGGQTIEDVHTRDFSFDPTILSGSGGQTLTISLDNSTSSLHNFSLPQEQLDQDVPPGQSVKVTVTLPANGALVFFCKYHRSRGMLGALEAG